MTTKKKTAPAAPSGADGFGQLLRQYGCGPVEFTGSDNAAVSHLVATDDRWVIRRYNDTAHLGLAFTTAPEPLT